MHSWILHYGKTVVAVLQNLNVFSAVPTKERARQKT
jgi:hypothetical protein